VFPKYVCSMQQVGRWVGVLRVAQVCFFLSFPFVCTKYSWCLSVLNTHTIVTTRSAQLCKCIYTSIHTVANPPVRLYIQPADRFPDSLPNDPMTFFNCFFALADPAGHSVCDWSLTIVKKWTQASIKCCGSSSREVRLLELRTISTFRVLCFC
jgi:hypothetical protein